MPWLMKAEPDSRIEKGKDVKVRKSILTDGRGLDRRSLPIVFRRRL